MNLDNLGTIRLKENLPQEGEHCSSGLLARRRHF